MNIDPVPTINLQDHAVFSRDADFNFDRYVYHYTRWERLLDIAHSGFRLGSLAYMNDPRESKNWYLGHTTFGNREPIDSGKLWKEAADYRRQVKVASFSQDIPGRTREEIRFRSGYARPRMWAQYGGNHTGVCIVIDRDGLDKAIKSQLGGRENSWLVNGPVEYIDLPARDPSTQSVQVSETDSRSVGDLVRDYFYKYRERIFFVKHSDWRDEAEYRWVYYDPDAMYGELREPRETFVNINGHVAALVLGADFSDSHLPVAQSFAEALGMNGDVVRCFWDRLNYRLDRFADIDGRWVPVRYSGAVVMNMRIGVSSEKMPPPP
jgi:hypothetical protein